VVATYDSEGLEFHLRFLYCQHNLSSLQHVCLETHTQWPWMGSGCDNAVIVKNIIQEYTIKAH